jgi:hypothetical protein
MVATALQPTAPARAQEMNPADLYAKINRRIKSLEVLEKRVDMRALVMAELRERRPVIVNRGFKWEGQIIQGGTEFLPAPEFLPIVAQRLETLEFRRAFTTKAMMDGKRKLDELRKVAAELAPLVSDVSKYRGQASQARQAEEQARQAVIMYGKEAEQAEKDFSRADKSLTAYMAKLDLEI